MATLPTCFSIPQFLRISEWIAKERHEVAQFKHYLEAVKAGNKIEEEKVVCKSIMYMKIFEY